MFKLVFNNNPLKGKIKASNGVNKPKNEVGVIVKLDNYLYFKKPDGSLIPIQEVKIDNP